ncbi:hypothetical protein COT72_00200 [archaeon CG10_big_fil_rev_8_21_14_0_10_43_11]|nr:MAG: hypothetical protein COT72_00200 [archaeon CG10_big_fil_rev_8_21_14_0_10_43_11]
MKKLAAVLAMLISASAARAHCPLCTGAIGFAVFSASLFGVDASIIGVFVGAFAISTGLWMSRKIQEKYGQKIPAQNPVIVLASFLLTVVPLMALNTGMVMLPLLLFGEPGSILNRVYSINSLVFGSVIGATTSLIAFKLHNLVKEVRGSVLFPYQSIAFALGLLTLVSIVLQLIISKVMV